MTRGREYGLLIHVTHLRFVSMHNKRGTECFRWMNHLSTSPRLLCMSYEWISLRRGLHLSTTSNHFVLPLRVDKTGGYAYLITYIYRNNCSMCRTIGSHMETMNWLLNQTYPNVVSPVHHSLRFTNSLANG